MLLNNSIRNVFGQALFPEAVCGGALGGFGRRATDGSRQKIRSKSYLMHESPTLFLGHRREHSVSFMAEPRDTSHEYRPETVSMGRRLPYSNFSTRRIVPSFAYSHVYIRYEELARDTSTQLRVLYSGCGCDHHKQCNENNELEHHVSCDSFPQRPTSNQLT